MTEDWTIKLLENEWFRFEVGSKSRPGHHHIVDLEGEKCLGHCTCERFRFTVNRERASGKNPKAECRHITIAKRTWADMMLPHFVKQLSKKPVEEF